MTAPRLLPAHTVSERTSLTESCLRKWAQRGVGPVAFKLGRRWVWPETDLDEWIAAQAAAGRAS